MICINHYSILLLDIQTSLMVSEIAGIYPLSTKVADVSPKKHVRNLSTTDGTKPDLNIVETRLWRLDSEPKSIQLCPLTPED